MYVDPVSLVYKELTDIEASALREMVYACMFAGVMPDTKWPLIATWMRAGNFDERQALLVISTVWCARASWSVLRHAEKRAGL